MCAILSHFSTASGSRVPRQINGQRVGCQKRRHLLNGSHILPRSGERPKKQPSGCTHGPLDRLCYGHILWHFNGLNNANE